jgi:isoleucyl-tRNA synthetase
VRAVQEARKQAGLQVSDRIHLRVVAADDMAEAIVAFTDYIKGETLAVDLNGADFKAGFSAKSPDGLEIVLARVA